MLLPNILGNDLFDTFDNFFYPAFVVPTRNVEKKLYGGHAGRIMKTDVREHETGYEILVDLPGFKKEEILRRERYSGSMSRSYFVGEDLKQEDIKAKFEDGVLTISIPKKQPEEKVEENRFINIE